MELMQIKHCQITTKGLEIREGLPYEEWEKIGSGLRKIEGCIQFWIGDWLRYGERTYKGIHSKQYDKAVEETGLERTTLQNIKNVAESISPSLRNERLSFNHHIAVAPLSPEEQKKWLEKAEEKNLSYRELRQEIKSSKALPQPELPVGKFNIIYADPPWRYDFSETESREIENKYQTMSLEEICAIQVPSTDNAVLYLWATAPKLIEALNVIESWGFEYVTHAIWDKEIIGMGYWFRGQHEILMVATKGQFSPPIEQFRISSVIRERRTEHSKKPLKIYDLIELWFPKGKYLELFSRNKRDNWTCWGNEL